MTGMMGKACEQDWNRTATGAASLQLASLVTMTLSISVCSKKCKEGGFPYHKTDCLSKLKK
jgi:hypothetical protein